MANDFREMGYLRTMGRMALRNAYESENSSENDNSNSNTESGYSSSGFYISVTNLALKTTNSLLDKPPTFRMFNKGGTNFSPKIYNPGWSGGSAGQIKTYNVLKTASRLIGWSGIILTLNDMRTGKRDMLEGSVDIGIGLIGMYGPIQTTLVPIGYGAGKIWGPSTWYGKNDNKWFE